MPADRPNGTTPSLQLLKDIRQMKKDVRVLLRCFGGLNRRLVRLEKGKEPQTDTKPGSPTDA